MNRYLFTRFTDLDVIAERLFSSLAELHPSPVLVTVGLTQDNDHASVQVTEYKLVLVCHHVTHRLSWMRVTIWSGIVCPGRKSLTWTQHL